MADMNDAFVNGLSALYNTEKLIMEGMPKMMGGVQNPQTKQVMEQHTQETQQQAKRLEQIFSQMGQTPNDIQPEGIVGILKENENIQSQGYDAATLEASVIAAAQRVEHYEIAGYGALSTWAKHLGHQDVAALLDQSLQEEKDADQKLTQAAEAGANPQAAQAA
jgi:ferritin-like metal-binding protein YciE